MTFRDYLFENYKSLSDFARNTKPVVARSLVNYWIRAIESGRILRIGTRILISQKLGKTLKETDKILYNMLDKKP